MKALPQRRSLLVGLPLVLGAVVAVAVLATGTVSAAPGKGPAKAAPGQVTIYSETFLPYSRLGDGDALSHLHCTDADGYGPGHFPNFFQHYGGTGHDEFFNTPDLTIGDEAMSVVAAEVCLQLHNESGDSYVGILFGVQDQDRNFTVTGLADNLTETDAEQACHTLTLGTPIALVNHPHLVLALDIKVKTNSDRVGVDGVTYTLQPTKKGDLPPGQGFVPPAS